MAQDRVSVIVKFPAPLLAEIDAACGSSPRMAWIVDACEDRLKGSAPRLRPVGGDARIVARGQRRVEPTDPVVMRAMAGVQLGPTRPKPGSMLISDKKKGKR